MAFDYHTIVIGSGSGGFTVAIGLTGLGKKVAVLERKWVGGDCTNVGCVPSKTLIHEAAERQTAVAALKTVQTKRDHLRDEEAAQLDHVNNLDLIYGSGRFLDPHRLEVELNDGGRREISAEYIVIATGSRPRMVEIGGLPAARALTNETLFELADAPKHLAIVGSGAVGMEMAFAFRKLGSEVTLLSRSARVLTKSAPEASEAVHASMIDKGIAPHYNVKPQSYDAATQTLHITADGHPLAISGVDMVLLASGRVRNIDNLQLERAGVTFDMKNGIAVDSYGKTSVPHIFAIGDVTPTSHYTHSANAQGRRVTQRIALPYLPAISAEPIYPSAIFSDPEVATIGMSPDAIAKRFHPNLIKRVRVDMKTLDRGYTDAVEHGFVMVDTMRLTGKILGATIVGPHAGDMLTLFTLAITQGISLYKIYGLVFPYPTYSEGIKKAADSYLRETLPHIKDEALAYVRYRFAGPPKHAARPKALPASSNQH